MSDTSRRKRERPKAVGEVLRDGPRALDGLLARARHLDRIDRALAESLDPRHAPHVRVANVRDGVLILATPVAPIAQRLTMEAPRLLTLLQKRFPAEFTRLEVKVTPDLPARQD